MSNLVECKSCQHIVDKTAKACPSCGVSNPGVSGKQAAGGCLVIILFAVGMTALLTMCSKDKTPEEVALEAKERFEAKCQDKVMAQVMAQSYVKLTLKAPASAKFPLSADVTYLGDCTHFVRSYVDAQNSFGAMIRTDTAVKIRYNKDIDNWELVVDPKLAKKSTKGK